MHDFKQLRFLLYLPIISAILFPFPSAGDDSISREHLTRSGKSIVIEERHPVGLSLSDIYIKSSGFEHNLSETLHDRDPIKSVHVADLDGNGFDEIYIITVSSGSGSYGNVIAYASNRDKSLSMIHFPGIQEENDLFTGYMGHDTFMISENKLIRSFPLYQQSDTNNKPTGGMRRITYGLFAGEAVWQLRITDSADDK
jgi:hypothetical protein